MREKGAAQLFGRDDGFFGAGVEAAGVAGGNG